MLIYTHYCLDYVMYYYYHFYILMCLYLRIVHHLFTLPCLCITTCIWSSSMIHDNSPYFSVYNDYAIHIRIIFYHIFLLNHVSCIHNLYTFRLYLSTCICVATCICLIYNMHNYVYSLTSITVWRSSPFSFYALSTFVINFFFISSLQIWGQICLRSRAMLYSDVNYSLDISSIYVM